MKTFNRLTSIRAIVMACAVLTAAPALCAETRGGDAPQSARISPSQYRQAITDIFGSAITISGRFEPETRDEGLLAIGARKASVSDTGLERYDDIAKGIADQVVNEENRVTLVPCTPANAKAADDTCAEQFVTRTGRMLYRRPLGPQEVAIQVQVANAAATQLHDFYAGLSQTLADMLISPSFLFRFKTAEPDPIHSGQYREDAYSKASSLSYLLWNTTPDEMLLKAAEAGEIHTKEGLKRQVDRMVSSPRVEGGVRAFFEDMLGFSDFETLSKDPHFFPRYTLSVKEDSKEQTLRTIVELLVRKQGDYRDIFTTPDTFLTRSLAALYNVPLVETTDNGQPQHWLPYSYPAGDPRAGILSEASFVALWSPAGRTSPTGRGKALRELILCQAVPPPPGNVDFKFVQDTSNPAYKTTRERLTAHRSEPMCAGCHRITDPLGLALENFDSAGGYRTTENGVKIDTSGEFNGVKFEGPAGLAKAIHDDPSTTSCVAKKVFAFGASHMPDTKGADWAQIEKKFADSKYNFIELLRQVALSDELYAMPAPQFASADHP